MLIIEVTFVVRTPYGADGEEENDVRRMKLQMQAQEQYMSQLQQRISHQSNMIENLNAEIAKLKQVIQQKDEEIERYSKRMEEERYWKEQDAQARDERENELKLKIRNLEIEIDRLKKETFGKPKESESFTPVHIETGEIENFLEELVTYYSKPTDDKFVTALTSLVQYCKKNGTASQRILGILSSSTLPKNSESLANKLGVEKKKIDQLLFNLERKGLIKQIGEGYALITSSLVQETNIEEDWENVEPMKVFDNLKTIVTVSRDKEQIIKAFDKARDALMEASVLSPFMRHNMSQLIEKMRRKPIDVEEILKTIDEWKEKLT